MTFTKNMFNEIKDSLTSKNESIFKEIMKFEPGKTYVVRLVPNVVDPKKTIYHYYHHSWNSLQNGKFVTALCPSTYGESCPIDSFVLRTYNNGTQEEKEKIRPITRKENWLVNAYIVSDPSNPENEGKVKVIRYGKELAKIINNAIDGDDADEFGVKIFDIANGCNFKIKCESRTAKYGPSNRMMTTYVSSKFVAPSTLEDMNSKKVDAIYESVHELDKIFKPKTQAELQRLLDEHYHCVQDVADSVDEDDDDVPVLKESLKTSTQEPSLSKLDSVFAGIKESTSENTDSDNTDEKLKQILASL